MTCALEYRVEDVSLSEVTCQNGRHWPLPISLASSGSVDGSDYIITKMRLGYSVVSDRD